MLDSPPAGARAPTAPARAAPARAQRLGGWWPALGLLASVLMHAGVMAALLLWPVRDPVEEPGETGSVALVFDDAAADAGDGAMQAAAPPAPPAPPAAPPPPAPAAEAQAVAPPPPAPPPPVPAAAAPPAPPATPEAPRDLAALPPDPAGLLPPPPPPSSEPEAAAPPPPAEAPEPPRETPPPRQAEPAPEPPAPQQAAAQPDPLPLPPPLPPTAQQQAAAQPSPPPRPPARPPSPPAAQGPVRLNAGAGSQAEPHLGSFALGAVVPPGADAGHRNAPPDYPAEARRRGEEGVVRLSLRVGPDGQVTAAEVETSSGFPALDRAAVEAARRWRFRPATRAGMPVAATLPTAVHFRLSDARGR